MYAHPEARSFNGAMRDAAVETLTACGHEVHVSDLYAMRFDAVGGPNDFSRIDDSSFFKYQREQRSAVGARTFEPAVQQQIDHVAWCDLLLLQFPLWWYSLPAILKGWIDRVFAMGFAYDSGRAHETGPLGGRKAMVALTTGGPERSFGPAGFSQPIDDVLFHIEYGMLHYAGMDVLPSFVVFGAARITEEDRLHELSRYRAHLRAIETMTPLTFPRNGRRPAKPASG